MNKQVVWRRFIDSAIQRVIVKARLAIIVLALLGSLTIQPEQSVRAQGTGITTRVSIASNGAEGNYYSSTPAISGDGRYVAFESLATNLVSGDTNSKMDIFVHDRQTAQTTRVSVATGGAESNGQSERPSISTSR